SGAQELDVLLVQPEGRHELATGTGRLVDRAELAKAALLLEIVNHLAAMPRETLGRHRIVQLRGEVEVLEVADVLVPLVGHLVAGDLDAGGLAAALLDNGSGGLLSGLGQRVVRDQLGALLRLREVLSGTLDLGGGSVELFAEGVEVDRLVFGIGLINRGLGSVKPLDSRVMSRAKRLDFLHYRPSTSLVDFPSDWEASDVAPRAGLELHQLEAALAGYQPSRHFVCRGRLF